MLLKRWLMVVTISVVCSLAACGGPTSADIQATVESAVQATVAAQPALVLGSGSGHLFDDFNYTGSTDPNLMVNAWTPRAESGGPGLSGATWSPSNISFIDDPDLAGNRLAQLSSATNGTAQKTSQAELSQPRKFYEGTYATRVHFTDAPASGPDGDNVVETFFTITPLNYDLDPNYGEIDYEYLPNGGWDVKDTTFYLTTWETYQLEPWLADNQQDHLSQSFAGWHTLMVRVAQNKVQYFIDGQPVAEHGDKFYPETPMAIDYNLWFISGGTIDAPDLRNYVEQVDWLYYAGNEILSPEQVDQRVADYRSAGVTHVDTVPKWTAPPVARPTATPTLPPAGPRPYDVEVKKVSGIKVDGTLTDWTAEPNFTLDQTGNIVYALQPGNWAGPSDFSSKIWLGWADDGLYVAAHITDDKLVQQWLGADIWQGDYLELQVDTQLEQDYEDHAFSADDFQLGFSTGDFASVAPDYHVWQGVVDSARAAAIQQAQVKTAAGYDIEVFIPNGLMPDLTLHAGLSIGLNVNPSDCDNEAEPQKLMMSTSPTRKRFDPTSFGKVTFVQ